jgi:hypothetical protein
MAAEQDNAAVVRRFWDLVWNSGDLPAIEELVDDDFTNFGIRQPGGHAALRHIVTAWRTAFPDLHIQIQEGVTNADLHRGALPNPDAVRLADHMGGHGQRRQALPSIRPGAVTLEGAGPGPAPAIGPDRAALIDGQVNRDASPHTESPGPSLRRRPQLGANRWHGVLRVGAREGPARTAACAVPAVLAEQDHPSPQGVRRL